MTSGLLRTTSVARASGPDVFCSRPYLSTLRFCPSIHPNRRSSANKARQALVLQVRAWLCWAEESKTLAIGALLCRRSERPCHRTTHDTEKSPPPHVHVRTGGKEDGRLTQV